MVQACQTTCSIHAGAASVVLLLVVVVVAEAVAAFVMAGVAVVGLLFIGHMFTQLFSS